MKWLDLTAEAIADLAHEALAAAGGWTMGVQGAVAEFTVVDGRVEVRRAGRTVEAVTAGGGLRLVVADGTQAFAVADPDRADGVGAVYLAVPRGSLPAPAPGVAVSRGDPASLRPEDGGDLLVDLAVGHAAAAFCVRTGDPVLGARLREVEGATWRDALARVGPAVVAASPHRVVTTPLGRVEVWAPIPPDSGVSPEGPHTHLLPVLLATGRELPNGVELPPELAPAAAFHPPPGWPLPGT
ncbi:MAG TPA: hypothetical protein VK848_12730 [Acidimicrobiia bacterium]|nr:hypothetical protein [Acidimicrobiia bacterium]